MSKQRVIDLRSKALALASEQNFDEKKKRWQEGYELLERVIESDPEDIDLWDLRIEFLANGAHPIGDRDRDELRLEAATNLIRLNPGDSDEPFDKAYSGDYAGNCGLYYQLFQILVDIGDMEDDWPATDLGRRAAEAIRKAIQCRPEDEDFLREEAQAVGLDI